ncbi:Planctomycete cytochrome C [Aquisphaera giovannonii]|uniref:Planctomycete cytochrome C n=1 Tax=Aquisphaera giovannonii TaxID=406548 RepID=A0A5B9WED5_9BACT|nr:PSD1 and planctomycete cytochrome C domain-containing protein [Aquisphaera giovannonii]QEH38415.1 Planctomycete cytochrome C [Aquisphaera giovannonii]
MPDRRPGRAIAAAIAALSALLAGGPARGQSAADVEAFEKEVRPVLVEKCASCHGPAKQKGGLRLDARAAILEGGDSGPAVVPGKPGESLLVQAVRGEGDLKMPPDGPLPAGQVAALERWVAAGAPWPADASPAAATRAEAWARHWAFRPMAHPEPPTPRDPSWVRTPVDAFVAARRDAAGLPPSPEADRRTLIRRVSYDLTGLPPTPEDVAAFVADPDPAAYEKLVDRLLASGRYGEHWARLWLDVARYADTKGYVYDREERAFVHSSAYRDWVVEAFNRDLPYDRFLLDQIAADQAEPGEPKALAALGFVTLGRRFLGVTHDIIDDRIDVVSRGTMGLTVACARCHDHKFDPIPTADYYSLYGVFMNCTERLVPLGEPAGDRAAREAFEAGLKKRKDALESAVAAARAEASRRIRSRVADYLSAQLDLSRVPADGFDTILYADDIVPASVRRWQAYLAAMARADDPVFRPWRRLAALPEAGFSAAASAALAEPAAPGAPPVNARVAAAFASPPSSMREAAERYGRLFAEVDREWQAALKADPAAKGLADPAAEALRRVLYRPDESPCWIPDEPVASIEAYLDNAEDVKLWPLQGEVDRWLIRDPAAPPYASALVDRAEIREPRVFKRGNAANPGDVVPRRFLRVVAGPDAPAFSKGSGRLELARAIVDPENPLTARVWVNRIWAHHFGAGLVRTPSDFGIRAEPPSHPELLDWLARRLIDGGWSTKAIHRVILLSSTYRQRSNGSGGASDEVARTKDPENRLLWRMNPHRLTFEETRDSLLAVTGELDPRVGGRGEPLFGGPENRRRTLYGLVDRQFLPGVYRTFDFANPDLHIPSRSETTVPQQALFALNHPFPAARARALAAKAPGRDDAAIRALFLAALQREPTAVEASAAGEFLANAAAVPAPATPPESKAWSYGCVSVDPGKGPGKDFRPMPFFDGKGWGGGPSWPDPKLGWARITAEGGHPGDDLGRSVARRWTSPIRGEVAVESTIEHVPDVGDGVRAWVVSGRSGVLKAAVVRAGKVAMDAPAVAVQPGDVIDFVVDIRDGLNSDQHLWAPKVRATRVDAGPAPAGGLWDAARDFRGPAAAGLTPVEQLAQVLLMSNEFLFVD